MAMPKVHAIVKLADLLENANTMTVSGGDDDRTYELGDEPRGLIVTALRLLAMMRIALDQSQGPLDLEH